MNLLNKNYKKHLKNWAILCLSTVLIYSCENSENFSLAEKDIAFDEMEEMVLESSDTSAKKQNTEQKIIKTGMLEFETSDLDKTYAVVQSFVKQNDGYIQRDHSGKGYDRLYREMQIRIPSENFQKVVDGISKDVNYFDTRTISSRDVTEEFIDLSARLKAKRELESRYLALLDKAKNVKEILDIERELSKIREDIEARQGRLEYLQSQVSYSTLNINFYKYISDSGVTQSYGQKIGNAFKSGWYGISAFFLGLLTIWPLVIGGIIAVFIVRRWLKKSKK